MTTSAFSRERTFSKFQAMTYGILCACPFLMLVGFSYRFFLSSHANQMVLGGPTFYLSFIAIIAVSVTLHELLHGIGWMLAGHLRWADVHFHLSAMMPTTSCREPLTKGAYLIGVLLPFTALGLTSIAVLLLVPGTLTLLAALTNLTLAGADLAIAWHVIREPHNVRIIDHPTLAGYVVTEE